MSFTIAIDGADEGAADKWTLGLRFTIDIPGTHYFSGPPTAEFTYQFSRNHTVEVVDLPHLGNEVFRHQSVVELDGALGSGKAIGRFRLKGLSLDDTLYAVFVAEGLFVVKAFHAQIPPLFRRPCIATCADGTSAENCITCSSGKVIVKVCC